MRSALARNGAMRRAHPQHGFTLIELMIVVAIVAVLAAIAVVSFSRMKRKAVKSEAFTNLAAIGIRQEMFRSEYGVYMSCKTQLPVLATTAGAEPLRRASAAATPSAGSTWASGPTCGSTAGTRSTAAPRAAGT